MHVRNIKILGVVFATAAAIAIMAFNHSGYAPPVKTGIDGWFPPYDFDAATFKAGAKGFGPFTRWWWPGNDVDNAEIQREIKLFAANGFSGVEIEPFSSGLNMNGPKEQLARQFSWDSASFYSHLQAAMVQAQVSSITVDMNAGSGWPMGGPFVSPDSSVLTLQYAEATVQGGQQANIGVPAPPPVEGKELAPGFSLFQKTNPSFSKLQAVIAAKVVKKEGTQTFLDESSVTDITSSATNGKINWQAPAGGEWKVIAIWYGPDGEIPKAIAANPSGWVTDPLDSGKVLSAYNHLFGPRTGLQTYFGRPLRAVFNDSYEFMADRHFTPKFIELFKKQHGYDITKYLPANLEKGYNNAYASFLMPGQKPAYVFGDEDWRLRYDYDQTIGSLMRNQFIVPTDNWFEKKGMLHRTQAYGVRMDIIGNSGAAHIPEAEQLEGSNSEGFVKLITSGAHLYNKPVVSQESFVFQNRAEMTTPQKIRLLADKSFAEGINQIVYHGTPYKYQTGEYGNEGYNPFSSPTMPFINFSSNINESYPYWGDIKAINQYIARMQYALRAGRPHTDVLIYFPFTNLTPSQIINNPQEIMPSGYFKGSDPESSAPAENKSATDVSEWYRQIWPLVNKLEAMGVTWDFVNDESLQAAKDDNSRLNIRGNIYEAVIVANAPYIQLATAQNLSKLAENSVNIVVAGAAPSKQPSFLDYKKNDATTKQLMDGILKQSSTKNITANDALEEWIKSLHTLIVRYGGQYSFARQIQRDMADGSRLQFIWNMSSDWQQVTLNISADYFKGYYLMDAETGGIVKTSASGGSVTVTIKPYGSILFYASGAKLSDEVLLPSFDNLQTAKTVVNLDNNWNIKGSDSTAIATKSTLFDWRTNNTFLYQGRTSYKTTFKLDIKEENAKYYLDMGTVYFSGDVYLNGKHVGEKFWAPYMIDITQQVKMGMNNLEIQVVPSNCNVFIGQAIKGNAKYAQWKGAEKAAMPAGLVGPVSVKEVAP